jgi:hypothetical protein
MNTLDSMMLCVLIWVDMDGHSDSTWGFVHTSIISEIFLTAEAMGWGAAK